jgi:hypothetical protein
MVHILQYLDPCFSGSTVLPEIGTGAVSASLSVAIIKLDSVTDRALRDHSDPADSPEILRVVFSE